MAGVRGGPHLVCHGKAPGCEVVVRVPGMCRVCQRASARAVVRVFWSNRAEFPEVFDFAADARGRDVVLWPGHGVDGIRISLTPREPE